MATIRTCISRRHSFAFLASLTGFLVAASFDVHAQVDESSLAEDDLPLEEVVVTGTRIKRRDFSSPSPVASIDREAFEFSGQPTLEDYLNQMPQLQPDFGRTSNNPGNGSAQLNLRGLGAERTLVLLNGRRVAPSGAGGAVDVNNLPRSLIERVEIITGGASTVYGSDAIAGVVNFITFQDFEGLGLDSSYSITEEGDAQIWDVNVAYGWNLPDGRGNLAVYAGYYDRDPLFASERELTSVVWVEDWDTGELEQGGSFVVPAGIVAGPLVDLGQGPVNMTWNPDGTPRAFDETADLYNFQPINYLQVPLERKTAGLMGHVALFGDFELYVEAGLARNEAGLQLAESPAALFTVVNTDNPVLTEETRQVFEEQLTISPGVAGMFLFRRMSELGPRKIDYVNDYSRFVVGVRGDFAADWSVDAWVTYTDFEGEEQYLNDGSRSRLQQGLLVDPSTGECFDPSGGCVALDVFGEGRLSQAGADFVRVPTMFNRTERRQWLASAVVTGPLFEFRPGSVEAAFGAEWRRDEATFRADDTLFTGDTMGFRGSAPIDGTESVYELYAEVLVPLLSESFGGQYLGLELGGRWSNYDLAGSVTTWKAGLNWQPVAFARVRAMLQHSVRAPNNAELFTAQFTESRFAISDSSDDPCSASNDPVGSGNAEKCVIQGLSESQLGIFEAQAFYPTDFIQGGNPALEPEESDALTVGVVLTPEQVPNLTLAIDYFDLEVTGTIGEIDANEICFDANNTGHAFCENIRRDQTGNVFELFEPISNRGLRRVRGIDSQLQYRHDLPSAMSLFGGSPQLGVEFLWTHLLASKDQENIVTEVLDCAGYFGWPCLANTGGTFPENRIAGALRYLSGPLALNLAWRWIDSTENAAPLASGNFGYDDPLLAVPTVSSYSYFDLGASYEFTDWLLLRLGVNNLLDKDPPQMADTVIAPNTDTGIFDVFGRAYYLSAQLRFQ
jgi:outer membrane receptor protein involved in Fe transport